MWAKFYKDYPVDREFIKYKVEPGKGIIGCEMHEIYGWGENYHVYKRKHRKSFFNRLKTLFKGKK